MKNWFYLLTFLILFLSLVTQNRTVKAQLPEAPNVLFISVDDLRATIGAYGDPLAKTPNIDKLAAESILFTRHYVQQPSCAPSRTSMLTGLRPDVVGVINHSVHFRDTMPDLITLPQFFKNAGYHTVGIGKIFHFAHGFQDAASWTTEVYGSNRNVKADDYVLPENRLGGKAAATEKVDVRDDAYPDGKYTDLTIDFLRKFQRSREPFFLAVGYQKPHLPFAAPSRYWDLYDDVDFSASVQPDRPINAPDLAFHNSNELRGYTDVPDEGPLSIELINELRHGYYASVSFIDAQIGKLLNTLDELGLRENTIIVFWSDHGFHLGEQDLWAKSTNFELSVHSPFMVSVPGMTHEGKRSSAFVESVDIYPTLAELANLELMGELSGVSLTPLIQDPNAEWRSFAFNQFPRPYNAAIGGRQPITHMGYSVRTDNWRFTGWYNVQTEEFEFTELYSLDSNPGWVGIESSIESVNVSGYPEYDKIERKLFDKVRLYRDQEYDKLYR